MIRLAVVLLILTSCSRTTSRELQEVELAAQSRTPVADLACAQPRDGAVRCVTFARDATPTLWLCVDGACGSVRKVWP